MSNNPGEISRSTENVSKNGVGSFINSKYPHQRIYVWDIL